MNQPAPDWPAAPAADAPPAPMATPPAPAAPPLQAMPQFAMPTSPEAALDVTAPLMPVMPQQPSAPGFDAPPMDAAPTGFAAPQAGLAAPHAPSAPALAPHVDHPTSLAMPTADHAQHHAMPTFAEAGSFSPQQVGGVAAAHPADHADRAALAGAPSDALDAVADIDPTGQWWAPGIALVLAVAALAWQLVAFYARVQLPAVRASQTPLTNFDNVVGSVPLASSSLGQVVGILLAAGALVIVLYGSRRGLREPQLQVAIGAIAALSMLAMVFLPLLRG